MKKCGEQCMAFTPEQRFYYTILSIVDATIITKFLSAGVNKAGVSAKGAAAQSERSTGRRTSECNSVLGLECVRWAFEERP